MRFIDLRHLSGPNVFASGPVTIARIELEELTRRQTTRYPGFAERLTMALPGLASHQCAAGRPGGFLDAMTEGTYFGHVTEHVALELSALAGRDVHLGRTMWAGADGRYDVMMACPRDEPADSVVPAELVITAMRIVKDLVAKRRPDFSADVRRIGDVVEQERLGVSTAAIAAAARRRDIPVRRVGALSMLRLGYGRHRRLVCAALTEQSSAIGVDIAADKIVTKQLLRSAGIPVPAGVIARSPQEAADALAELGAPIVVKPRAGNHGANVAVGLRTRGQAASAYEQAAAAAGPAVIVEKFVPGSDYRVLVIDGQLAAAAELRPAAVTGNGTSRDVSDTVHDDVAVMCRRAAAVSGLDICGIDMRLGDISAPLLTGDGRPAQQGAVLELNACPGLRMHLSPTDGAPRDVAAVIVDKVYPPGMPSRIPVIAVTGTNGKTTTVRMIGHILRQAGLRVGMSTTDGVYSGGRLLCAAEASGPRSAEMVLDDTTVEAAVLETARGGIIRHGLGYDRADVAVITNISAGYPGSDGIDDLDELTDVKALLGQIHTGGTVVLNADDPATAALAGQPAVRGHGAVIRLCSLIPGSPVLEQHTMAGGISYGVHGGQLVEIEAGRERQLIGLAEVPGAFGGKAPHVVANALAAAAAARASGINVKDIKSALATFTADANPGRGDTYLAAGTPVILDYGHNAAALAATGEMISKVWPGAPAAAVTLPGDGRDDLLAATAESIAAWFGRVVVYEDGDLSGRRLGEMRQLIISAIRRVCPDIVCEEAAGPEAALRRAVELAAGGPVLFLCRKLGAARDALDAVGAQPCPEAAPMPADDDASRPDEVLPGDGLPAGPVPAGARRDDPALADGMGTGMGRPILTGGPVRERPAAELLPSAAAAARVSAQTPAAPAGHAWRRRRLPRPQPHCGPRPQADLNRGCQARLQAGGVAITERSWLSSSAPGAFLKRGIPELTQRANAPPARCRSAGPGAVARSGHGAPAGAGRVSRWTGRRRDWRLHGPTDG